MFLTRLISLCGFSSFLQCLFSQRVLEQSVIAVQLSLSGTHRWSRRHFPLSVLHQTTCSPFWPWREEQNEQRFKVGRKQFCLIYEGWVRWGCCVFPDSVTIRRRSARRQECDSGQVSRTALMLLTCAAKTVLSCSLGNFSRFMFP